MHVERLQCAIDETQRGQRLRSRADGVFFRLIRIRCRRGGSDADQDKDKSDEPTRQYASDHDALRTHRACAVRRGSSQLAYLQKMPRICRAAIVKVGSFSISRETHAVEVVNARLACRGV